MANDRKRYKNMTLKRLFIISLLSATGAVGNAQRPAVHFDMTVSEGMIAESVSGQSFAVSSVLPACDADGLDGRAMRFDGYSNYVMANLPGGSLSTSSLTISAVFAAETYPMMNVAEAENVPSYGTVCGNLDETAKTGFALQLSSQGQLRLRFASAYANGYVFTVDSSEKLPLGRWSHVTAVLDKDANLATLYLNGSKVGSCKMSRSEIVASTGTFYIGKDAADMKSGPFLINTFCGLVDDIAIYNECLSEEEIARMASNVGSATPDFNYPASRYAESLWRPQFHGMPSGGWTNECHGMTFADGKYHLFFQKNANGPYMARLHWGHISSENLYKWTEEPIAIAPGEPYDIKGCWSGCLYEDDNNTVNLLYTAVDNGRAVIARATPDDKGLVAWTKQGIVVNGRPNGLSDDFRDPYFFTAGGNKYIIVGTGKNGVGACTLHKYENGQWTNDGKIFFRGTNANQHGTFWEMPNMTDMGNGRWLFTVTPLGMGTGVRTVYWVGRVNDDGTFAPDHEQPRTLEMNGMSKDGYGLLSPTICRKDGKVIMLGIVPDKLPSEANAEMGWAHNYSLPREIGIDEDGYIVQKPFEGLAAMRSGEGFEMTGSLSGELSLAPVSGRQMELLGEFVVGSGEMGFNFFKSEDGMATLSYDAGSGMLTLDFTALARRSNDTGSYGGVYAAALPEKPKVGETIRLHVFVDGSIVDVFVNDRWAYSVRIFPTDAGQIGAEAFATSPTQASVRAWTLDAGLSGNTAVKHVWADDVNEGHAVGSCGAVFNMAGQKCSVVPQKGIYIKNGKKHVAR